MEGNIVSSLKSFVCFGFMIYFVVLLGFLNVCLFTC